MGFFRQPLILAHRGYHEYYPENTLEALEEALEAGADGFELDIRGLMDGSLALYHDSTVRQSSGRRVALSRLHAADLQEMAVKKRRWDYPNYTVSFVFLEKVLERFSGQCVINVEIKWSRMNMQPILDRLGSLLQSLNYPENIIVSSFRRDLLHFLKKSHPAVRIGLLTERWDEKIRREMYHYDYYSIHPHYSLLGDERQAEEILAGEKKIFIWTVNEWLSYLEPYLDVVEGIITDDPLGIMQQIRR